MLIVPGILTDDIKVVEKQAGMAAAHPDIEWVQIDFLDGIYANNWTVRPNEISNIKNQKSKIWNNDLKFEAHLMVSQGNLAEWLREALEAEFDRILVQIESIKEVLTYVDLVKASGREVGVSLDLDTRVGEVEREVLKKLDVVQVMTVGAGAQGQKFVTEMLWKVRQLSEIRSRDSGASYLIQADGGVNEGTIKLVRDEGVDLAVVGSGLFKDDNFGENLKRLDQQIKE